MPVPKYKTSKSKRDMRRSHHAIAQKSLSLCPNCQEVKLPHVACPSCGQYKNRQVLEPKATEATWDGSDMDLGNK